MTHVQALIDAVGVGAVYALIAVGIGLVFGVLRLINFAYGQLIMVAAYMLVFTQAWGDAAAIGIALATAVFAALVMERVAFRPLRGTSPATMLVATFAISYLLQNLALLRYTYRNRPVGDSVGVLGQLNRAVTIGSLDLRWVTFLAIGVVVGGMNRLLSATLGGFMIGFVNSFLGFELATQGSQSQTAIPFTSSVYLPSVIFVLVILVLLLRPEGLFTRRGQAAVERV